MKTSYQKVGLVLGGYILACLAAGGAVYVNQLFTPDDVAQASAGMSAFGDLILFVAAFFVLSLMPTGLALFFLFKKLRAGKISVD